ncbi:MAG TPA: gfo/Idh/MocA family oxidoreductase, partial [Chitinophagaceae bacterium]|nr:gfo/Idh/MocA family oxidoreductase [Chitinophagaceae bacterium]
MKRRQFIRSSSAFLGGAAVANMLPMDLLASTRKVAASDKIRIGAIGVKGMGWADLSSVLKDPRAQCVSICDVDTSVLEQRSADLAKLNFKVNTEKDYRRLL